MSDLISRQAAIDAIEEYADRLQMVDWKENPGVPYKAYALNWCINTIRDLPSAQPQRMRGKWTYGEDEYGIDGYHCDKCGFFVPWDYTHKFINFIKDYHFCPNCGADMREVEEDG